MKELIDQINEVIPVQVLLPILIIQFILVIIALISCFKAEVTRGPKWMWILIIIFTSMLGPILYFIFGRREN